MTGTDTGVGKTRIAQALLMAAAQARFRAIGMKPIASGAAVTPDGLRNDDAEALMRAANVPASYSDVNPYVFAPAIAPHLAAHEAGIQIRLDTIGICFERLAHKADYMIVEGAGGWLVPISDSLSMADVACALGMPVVLVVGMRLGCLNHALLTEDAISRSGLPIAGWVANCVEPVMDRFEANLATLQNRIRAPLLATVSYSPTAIPQSVVEEFSSLYTSPAGQS